MVTEFPSSPEEENQVTNIPIINDKLSFGYSLFDMVGQK